MFLFDPKIYITRIHATMIINNPGNVITEKIHGIIVTQKQGMYSNLRKVRIDV